MGLSENEEQELSALVEEMELSDFERRGRRLLAADARLKALAEAESARTGKFVSWLAPPLEKARRGEPLTDDEFIHVNLGFTREDFANGEPLKERIRMLERFRENPGQHPIAYIEEELAKVKAELAAFEQGKTDKC